MRVRGPGLIVLSLAAAAAIAVDAGAQKLPVVTWQAQPSGVTARLRGVSAVSSRVAWASGAGGTVLRTTDGGESWRKLAVPGSEALDFRDVDAMSERLAYVLSIGPGEASRICKTTDGGATWAVQLANEDPKVFLDAMAFSDESHGIAFSDSVNGQLVIFATSDGRTWSRVPPEGFPPALPDEGAFAASGTNVAVLAPSARGTRSGRAESGRENVWIATGGRVLRSSDGGRTWKAAPTPLATGPTAGLFSIAFRDALHGVIVGGDYRQEGKAVDNVATSSDGGVTWTLAKEHGLGGFRSVVAWLTGPGRALLAVGPTGADVSVDDGLTWTKAAIPESAGPGFDSLSLAPGGVGWATGQGGRIARVTVK